MTKDEFNKKYLNYLEPEFCGLNIDIPELTEYLNYKFQQYIKDTVEFKYHKIENKFGYITIRCNLCNDEIKFLEKCCQVILDNYNRKNEKKKRLINEK